MFKHQGDIPFAPYHGKIEGELVKHNGSHILALGEKTGHKHVISVPDPKDMTIYKTEIGEWIVDLRATGTVTHNQHGTITLEPGVYRVGREREIDWFSQGIEKKVVD